LNSKKEDEGGLKFPPEPQIVRGTKVLEMCFQCAPIDLNGEMKDMEELGGMKIQLETSQ
jgi:hypothetical protein